MIDQKHIKTLELDKVLQLLSTLVICEDAKALALSLQPQTEYKYAVKQLNLTVAANTFSNKFGYPGIYKMTNSAVPLRRAEMGGSLSLRELLDVAAILKTMRSLSTYRTQQEEETQLEALFECLYVNKALETRLTDSIISAEELDDNASAELSQIRRKIRNASVGVRTQLDGMIKSQTFQKFLQDPIVTIRDGRFVLPVKSEYRGEVKGLVHDTSSSGATLFVEPIAVVELNNEIRILQSKEQQEIARIIAELSALVGECAALIKQGYDAAIELDLQFAKSRLADKMRASVPTLTQTGETVLKKARHPLILIDKAVPIDIAVGGQYDTLVITGPNTGGKTVAIKTLGLLTLMAMCGLMIPASQSSVVSVYEQVLADIGDEQSIEQSLSTFSSHMKNIISIVGSVNERSLVLLDELGAGTDPVEGAALAISIIERLRARGAKVLATTHYPEIKLYALDTAGVENASCEFDVATLRPTYRLLTGIPGRSNAFLISQKLGLDEEIIEHAKALISNENTRFEDVVSELESTRQSLEQQRQEAKRLRQEAEAMHQHAAAEREKLLEKTEKELEQARTQARRIIEETRVSADILFEQLQEIKKEKDAERFSQLLLQTKQDYRDTMRELEDKSDPVRKAQSNVPLERPLEKGDIVYITTLGKEGIVLKKPEGSTVYIQAGVIKTSVPISDVVLGGAPKQSKAEKGRVTTKGVASAASRSVEVELNLRGMDAQQAIMELDAFIDKAVLTKIPSVRIIHGKGTGVLRQAVQQRLRQHKAIESFRLGRYGEGEDGVTIAVLK